MCETLLKSGKIREQTFQKIKDGILQFIADWYAKVMYFGDKYTFSFEGWKKSIGNLYGKDGIGYILKNVRRAKVKSLIKRFLKRY